MTISLYINNAVKKYGDVTVIPDLSLDVKEGELFTLLGPSGCGKTTLLRMIAGFNTMEGGTIHFEDKLINSVPPGERNIGMVFQNYAIFPHLTVAENVAFGLKNRKFSKSEINEKIDEILELVQMLEYRDRKPENLSGGQQQRVALARAVVIRPDILLMDEPLSNLDAKLRVEMRDIIKEIQSEVGITTIYVTHDQEEAMAISDRMAIMKKGVIQQIGTPQEVYQRPHNTFVASFIGRTNLIKGLVKYVNEKHHLKLDANYALDDVDVSIQNDVEQDSVPVIVSVRPDEFVIADDEVGLKAKIVKSTFLGQNTQYVMELSNEQQIEVLQKSEVNKILEPDSIVYLKIDKQKMNVFNEEGEFNYTKGAQGYDA